MLLRFWPARGPRLAGLLAALAALAAPSAAHATSDLVVTGSIALGADAPIYKTFTVKSGGTVTVKTYQAGSMTDTGWLTIRANTITVEKGGKIVADAAGYPGQDGKAGICQLMEMPATACAGAGSASGLPGGGGGFFGKGANGTLEQNMGTCTDLAVMSPGGAAFTDPKKLDLGSAGGAGQLANPMLTAGGAGGGGIRLIAATVTIDGTVSANGATVPIGLGGVGPGGGSGGAIEISTVTLGGTGTLSVAGGDGAHGAGINGVFFPNNGGGGSGGVVLFHLPSGMMPPATLMVVADGGKTGDCPASASGAPGGSQSDALADPCLDADGDGFKAKSCGGDDCDDGDPAIHPGAMELCNGVSDNCGPVDAPPNDCTAKNLVCGMSAGVPACVAPMADAGPDAGADLNYIQYGGGCGVPDALPGRAAPVVSLALAALAIAARRRRRK